MHLNYREFTIRCIDCNLDLLDIVDKLEEKSNRIRVICPKCKNLTYFYNISDSIGYIPCKNYCIKDFTYGNPIIVELE